MQQVGVGKHHSLGEARGATRIENTGQVIPSAITHGKRLGLGQQGFIVQQCFSAQQVGRGFRLAQIDHVLNLVGLFTDSTGMGQEDVVHQQDLGGGILDGIEVFRHRPTDVHGHHNPVRPHAGKQGLQVAVGIQCQQRNAIARCQAQVLKRPGELGNTPFNREPIAAPFATDRGHPLRKTIGGPADQICQIHSLYFRVWGQLRSAPTH